MNTLKKYWLQITLLLLPFIYIALNWANLPSRIPMQWGLDGTVNKYSSSPYAILALPCINVFMFGLYFLLPKLDPKQRIADNMSTIKTIFTISIGLLTLIFFLQIYAISNPQFNMGLVGQMLLPILFLVLGNYLGKIRPNYFVGIRTPWTLEHEDVWVKTHRFTGYLWMVISIVVLLLFAFVPSSIFETIMIIYLAILIISPFVYSYMQSKKLHPSK